MRRKLAHKLNPFHGGHDAYDGHCCCQEAPSASQEAPQEHGCGEPHVRGSDHDAIGHPDSGQGHASSCSRDPQSNPGGSHAQAAEAEQEQQRHQRRQAGVLAGIARDCELDRDPVGLTARPGLTELAIRGAQLLLAQVLVTALARQFGKLRADQRLEHR